MSKPLPPLTSLVECEGIPWAELQPGFELKLLRIGEGSGRYTVLTRLHPGVFVPTHRHHGEVHAWTISGNWRYREYDWVAGPGDYVYEPRDSVHTLQIPETSKEPNVTLFIIDQPQDYFDDGGNVMWVQDDTFIVNVYRQALDAKGIPFPKDVLP